MVNSLLRFDCTTASRKGLQRDQAYSVKKNGVHIARMLLDNRPRDALDILQEEEEFQEGCFEELPYEIHATTSMMSSAGKQQQQH